MPKKSGKNSLMSKEGLKMLGRASASAAADTERRVNPPRLKGAPPAPPGANTPKARLEWERAKSREKIKTGNVKTVKPGSTRIGPLSGRGGGAGGGGGLWTDQIR